MDTKIQRTILKLHVFLRHIIIDCVARAARHQHENRIQIVALHARAFFASVAGSETSVPENLLILIDLAEFRGRSTEEFSMPDGGHSSNRKLTIDFLSQLARDAYTRQASRWSPNTPAEATHIPAPVRVIAFVLALAITIALCIGGALLAGCFL